MTDPSSESFDLREVPAGGRSASPGEPPGEAPAPEVASSPGGDRDRRPPRRLLPWLGLSILGSPAAAALPVVLRRSGGAVRRAGAGLVLLATLAVASALVAVPLRWQWTAVWWGVWCLCGGALVAWWAPRQADETNAKPDWARQTVRLALPLVFFLPSLIFVLRLCVWAPLGPELARLHPEVASSQHYLLWSLIDLIWAIPAGLVFVAMSLRRGRLQELGDTARALFAGCWLLFCREVILFGTIGLLATQAGALIGHGERLGAQTFLMLLAWAVAAVPVTLHLAWGRGSPVLRSAAVALLMAASVVSLGLWTGLTAQGNLSVARWLERRGDLEGALEVYERSLLVGSPPKLQSYLQHRVGLLRLKLGDFERAKAAFELVVTTRDGDPDLVDQGLHFLERLRGGAEGKRSVLEGVEVRTERRAAYCAPNTLSLVLGYWKREPVRVADLGEQIAVEGSGTLLSAIPIELERQGFEHILVPFADLDDLRWLVDRGLPALVYIPQHVLAVFGYDDRLATVVTYDTAQWDIWVDQPYDDLLAQWADDHFLLGVVVPTGDPAFDDVRGRYDAAESEAAWHWYLGTETLGDATARRRHYERAVEIGPSFYPAAWSLLGQGSLGESRRWIETHGDPAALLATVHRVLERPHADRVRTLWGLARWHRAGGEWAEILELAERYPEVDLAAAEGLAAYRSGQPERAANLLGPLVDEDELDIETLGVLMEARRQLRDPDGLAAAALSVLQSTHGDRLEPALELALAMGPIQGPDYLRDVYETALISRPWRPDLHLGMARAELERVREGTEKGAERESLYRARRAAHLAHLLADEDSTRAEAESVLEQAREGLRRLDGRRSDP